MSTEPPATGWLPAALNRGHTYRDRLGASDGIAAFYAARYAHSALGVWRERLAAGEIWCNGQQLWGDGRAQAGDQLVWHRPPWQEAAVPVLPNPLFDDGDLLAINKPRGLPVLPAGGFLEHTLLTQLQQRHQADPLGIPRPVHRLGRFTSGLLVCARQSQSRAWLSAQLRESTAAATAAARRVGSGGSCKLYRALTVPLEASWGEGESREITIPIGRCPHPLVGEIWCASLPEEPAGLPSHSTVTLLQRRKDSCLVAVAIATGRPHQIRIHTAAIGAPLIGDPLYRIGGGVNPDRLPGDGGYRLHAHRFELQLSDGRLLLLEAPLPKDLESAPSDPFPS